MAATPRGRSVGAVLLACLAVPGPAAARPAELDRDALRRAVAMPKVELRGSVVLDSPSAGDPPAALDAMERELEDPSLPAARLLEIASSLAESGRTDATRAAFSRAERLFRADIAAAAGSGEAVAGLARCLAGLHRPAEARALLRKRREDHPDESPVRRALGHLLAEEASELLDGERLWGRWQFVEPPRRGGPAECAKAGALLLEAWRLLEEPGGAGEAARDRAQVRAAVGCLWLRAIRWEVEDPSARGRERAALGSGPIPLLLGAADREEAPSVALVAAISAECSFAGPAGGRGPAGALAPPQFPPGVRDQVERAAVVLERRADEAAKGAAGEPASASAAVAAATAGLVRAVVGEPAAAITHFEASVRLDPAREDAWDLLLGMHIARGDLPAMTAVSRRRLALSDTPRNRLLLAKCLDREGRTGEALDALGGTGGDGASRLARAVLVLRTADHARELDEVGTALSPVFFESRPAKDGGEGEPLPAGRLAELEAARAAVRALRGDVPGALGALNALDPPLDAHPAVRAVRAVLEAAR